MRFHNSHVASNYILCCLILIYGTDSTYTLEKYQMKKFYCQFDHSICVAESDIPDDRCLQGGGETMPDTVHDDHYAETKHDQF
jgi:hypothetical protein